MALQRLVKSDNEMHLVKRESCRRHSNENIQQVCYQLCLRVQGQWKDRRWCSTAHQPYLSLPQTIQLVECLPTSLCEIKSLFLSRGASGREEDDFGQKRVKGK